MAEWASPQRWSSYLRGLAGRWRDRLNGRRAVLLAAAALFLALAAFDRLTLVEALVALLFIAAVSVLAPRTTELARRSLADTSSDALREATARQFADALPDPCIILDRRSIVVHANPSARHEFAGTRPGQPISNSLRHPALLSAIDLTRRTRELRTVELHQTVPAESWHKVAIAPLRAPEDTLQDGSLLILTMRSLTEEKRIDAMRADFVANASHELRTPLTSLVGFIDTLLGPAAKDEAARENFLGIMRMQAARMSKLIDDLLSLSRIEMRQHMRPTSRTDLAALLREVAEGLQAQAREAGVSVTVATPDGEALATGERDELYEVFENLLDNAIKYGGGGGSVEVVLAEAASRHGHDYMVTVTDHGAGVEPEHVPRLTERFYRVDAESSRRKKGTGLGLAIVKHIVQRHRGTLAIRSRPGEGTRVEVLLPR